jgi:polar amino acid transport system substrate-binding protein
VKFEDGSVGNLTYLANGDKALAKEYIEIFGGERSFIIDNFRQGLAYAGNKELKVKLDGKGHKQEVQEFLASVKAGKECPISFESIYKTTLTTFKIVDSLNTGLPQEIN